MRGLFSYDYYGYLAGSLLLVPWLTNTFSKVYKRYTGMGGLALRLSSALGRVFLVGECFDTSLSFDMLGLGVTRRLIAKARRQDGKARCVMIALSRVVGYQDGLCLPIVRRGQGLDVSGGTA